MNIHEKLAESGLVIEDLPFAKEVSSEDLQELHIGNRESGLYIPYYNIDKTVASFFRIRHLLPSAFATEVSRRYSQQAGTAPHAYLSPCVDWQKISIDPSIPLVITEGEFKAACACKNDLPTIGLGGVWSFLKPNTDELVDPISKFVWANRRITVVYDSDTAKNTSVQLAQLRLVQKLSNLRAVPFICSLPASNKKLGLDDYIVKFGVDALKDLLKESSLRLQALTDLIDFNNEYVAIKNRKDVLDVALGTLVNYNDLVNMVCANRMTVVQKMKGNPPVPKKETVNLAALWKDWPGRKEVSKLVYEPGKDKFVDGNYNLWPGWGTVPSPGNVEPFLKLIKHFFADDSEEVQTARKWFECWLALPIQKPGYKMSSAVLIWSPTEGSGKSWLGQIVKQIYGTNGIEIGQDMLMDHHNRWSARKQFVLGDEITGADSRKFEDIMKALVTRKELTYDQKYHEPIVLADRSNLYMTSNRPRALQMSQFDRRYFVWEVQGSKETTREGTQCQLSTEFKNELHNWVKQGGVNHLHQWLLDMDISSFRHDEPPITIYKSEMIDMSKSELELWVQDVITDYPKLMTMFRRKFANEGLIAFTAQELLQHYVLSPNASTLNVTANTISRALRKLGLVPYHPWLNYKLAKRSTVYVVSNGKIDTKTLSQAQIMRAAEVDTDSPSKLSVVK